MGLWEAALGSSSNVASTIVQKKMCFNFTCIGWAHPLLSSPPWFTEHQVKGWNVVINLRVNGLTNSFGQIIFLLLSSGLNLDFKNLQTLEICGGGLTDAGVLNIKGLASLTLLNLSQNCNLTDKTLEMISGIKFSLLKIYAIYWHVFN